MAEFNYEKYIRELQERTTESQISCSEYKGDNYTSYYITLPNGTIVLFIEYQDNTREIYYHFKNQEEDKVYKEVGLIEHEPGKYHVKVVDQQNLNIKIFGTHLDYDSDEDVKKVTE